MFCKKGVLQNFAKFTGKHLFQSLFFKKVADLRPSSLLKKRLWHMCFPVNFAKFPRIPILTEYLRWLLLNIVFVYLYTVLFVYQSFLLVSIRFTFQCLRKIPFCFAVIPVFIILSFKYITANLDLAIIAFLRAFQS